MVVFVDHVLFELSALEARSLDPQQVLVLQTGYLALRSGNLLRNSKLSHIRDALMCSDIGVCVGVEPSGIHGRQKDMNVFSASGGALSITSGRLSYSLGLVGPCYSIDVACASSLAALHVCAFVGLGEISRDGIVIGTKILSETVNQATSMSGMTSPLGRCHTFDHRADGYCRGEGCGACLVSTNFVLHASLVSSAV